MPYCQSYIILELKANRKHDQSTRTYVNPYIYGSPVCLVESVTWPIVLIVVIHLYPFMPPLEYHKKSPLFLVHLHVKLLDLPLQKKKTYSFRKSFGKSNHHRPRKFTMKIMLFHDFPSYKPSFSQGSPSRTRSSRHW